MKKRILGVLLALAMIISSFPIAAFAADVESGWTGVAGDNGTMAYRFNGQNFDIHGTFDQKWKSVTFSDNGFTTYVAGADKSSEKRIIKTDGSEVSFGAGGAQLAGYDDVTLKVKISTVLEDGAVKIEYIVKNNGDAVKTFSLGSGADVQIGRDDYANITKLENGNGFTMVSSNEADKNDAGDFARFNFFAKGVPGYVTDVDSYWFGHYRQWTNNIYNNKAEKELIGTDSGMVFSWQDESIAAGETKIYSVLMGIGGQDSVNIIGKAQVDPYDEENPPATFSITVNPCDPKKNYALMLKENSNWVAAPNPNPKAFGTKVVDGVDAPVELTNLGNGWYRNDADKDQKITFYNILPGKEYRVEEREAVTDKKLDNATALPKQLISDGVLTSDTVPEGQYALYKSDNNGENWTVAIPTAVKDQVSGVVNGLSNWYKNTASNEGKLTFTYAAEAGKKYKIVERAPRDNGAATKSVLLVTDANTEYSLWQNGTQIAKEPSAIGTEPKLLNGSATGWYGNTAVENGAFEWSGLDASKEYNVKSRKITEDKTTVNVSAIVVEDKAYALYIKNGDIWELKTNVGPTGDEVAKNGSTDWWKAKVGQAITWGELEANHIYKIQEKVDATSEASDTAFVSVISAAADDDKEYALYSFDGNTWAIVNDTNPTGGVSSGNGWFSTTENLIQWNSPGTNLTYQIKSRSKDGADNGLTAIKVDAQTARGYDYAVKGSTIVTGAVVKNDAETEIQPTATSSGWYASSEESIYRWTITATSDENYAVLKSGEFDAKNSISVEAEGTRSYAVYVKDSSGNYVPSLAAATGTDVRQSGGEGWYKAASGTVITFAGLDPTRNYQIKATVVTAMDSLVPPAIPSSGGVDGDNSRPTREVYSRTDVSGAAIQIAKITVANTSATYEYALAEVITAANGTKTYSRGNYTSGGSDIIFDNLDDNKIYVIYSRLKATTGTTSYPRRSAELATVKSSTNGSNKASSGKVPVIVDGVTQNIGTQEVKNDRTIVNVDQGKLTENIEKASQGGSVVIPVSRDTNSATAQLVVANVEEMAAKNMTLTLQSGNVAYNLGTAAVDTKVIGENFPGAAVKDIVFNVTIIQGKSLSGVPDDIKTIIDPVEFNVTATYGGKTIEINTFRDFVNRKIEVTKEQAENITTAIVLERNGTLRHVPTKIVAENGKYYAIINSMTNSTYALIENNVNFADVSGKWFEKTANEMGSRKVMSGVGENMFNGGSDVKRAEVAAILVNALGLPTNDVSTFSDVAETAWYTGAVATAVKYGIIDGVGNNKFAPNAPVTRQEVMAMIYRSSKLIHFKSSLNARNLAKEFSDYGTELPWASEAVAWNINNNLIVGNKGKINPKNTISRAEVSTVVLRLLQRAELVDVRD